ncbi:MAG: tetratricopeptide repeat protein [Myxococcales bacterium]|nr:tetratricopeptide repeat protein [Myxococcales bacterium]
MDAQIKHHLTVGREFYQAGEYEQARPHLEAVRDAHDDYADVHNMLGFIHYEQGRPQQACGEFERALAINPHYTEAALNLSVVYNEMGRYDEGRRLYEQVHGSRGSGGLDDLEPLARGKIANMHRELGEAYTAVGLLEHAIKEYRKALRVCPTFVDIRTKLANTLRDLGRFDESIDEFQAICDLSPGYVPGRTHYGVTLWRLGRIDEARAQWQAVLEREPENRSCQVYLSMTAPRDEAKGGASGPG